MKTAAALLGIALALSPFAAHAQTATPSPTAQALTQCVNDAMTDDDNTTLMRWIFVAMARHPSVSGFASITDAQRTDVNRQMGALTNRLLLDACPNEARAALQSDGDAIAGVLIAAIGERAMTEFVANADVNAGIADMANYVDRRRLMTLMGQH